MSQRLPLVGSDNNTWGSILNGFLQVSLNADGTINSTALSSAGAEMTSNKAQPSGYASLNASTLVPTAQLGSGTASSGSFLRGDSAWTALTAAQVANAADTSSSSTQAFTGTVTAPALAATGLTGATATSRYVGATTSGAPVTGTFSVGDFIIDRTANIWVCTTAGSPGTWSQLTYVPTAGVSPGGFVFVTGLVNDGGVTDNTTALSTAAALLPSSGGTLFLPAGKFGCNWTVPANVALVGTGSNTAASSSSPGATTLCGVNSLSGSQAQVLNCPNNNNTFQNVAIDAGGSGASYSCSSALVVSGNDFSMTECAVMNGSQVALNISGARANLNMVQTNQSPATFTQRTITATGGTTSGSTTITDSGASFTSADVNRQVSGTGIPLGSWISSITNSTTAVINQAATSTNSGISITVYQADNAWLGSLDGSYHLCRFKSGTKRITGAAGFFSGIHFYFPPATGATGLCNTVLASTTTMDAIHFDTTPDSTGSLLVHTAGAAHSVIGSSIMSESVASSTFAAYTENAATLTGQSVTFGVVVINQTGGTALSSLVNLAGGANSKLSMAMVWANTSSLSNTSGTPNIFAATSPSTSAGPITINYASSIYGVGQVVSAKLNSDDALTSGQAQASPIISVTLTAGTWLVTATLTVTITTTNGVVDGFLTFGGTGTLTGGACELRPSSTGAPTSAPLTATIVVTAAGTLGLQAYPAATVSGATAKAVTTAGSLSAGATNIICTRVA